MTQKSFFILKVSNNTDTHSTQANFSRPAQWAQRYRECCIYVFVCAMQT
jgi:hypothetical protein